MGGGGGGGILVDKMSKNGALIRRVADVFEGVFVLTGVFIKGGYQIRVPKARASRGVWRHAPSGNFEI